MSWGNFEARTPLWFITCFSHESPVLASVGIIFLCETRTQRRKLNLNSSSALNSRLPDGWTGLRRPGGLGEAVVGAPWSLCSWHRCLRRAPSPGPAHLQDTAAPPSSRFSVRDALRAWVLASSVGCTGQWRPEPAIPHPARPSRGTMSSAHMRWGGSGFLWHIKTSHRETGIRKSRATSGCLRSTIPQNVT